MAKRDLDFLCDKIDFPAEFREVIFPLVRRIEQDYNDEYTAIDKDRCNPDGYAALAVKLGENVDAVMLAACMMMGIDSKVRYDEMGVSEDIYYASMRELTIWSKRCYLERGHIGIYGHDWMNNFIEPHVFRIGRLEFERMKFEKGQEYHGHGVDLKGGDPVINIHIPEDGALRHDEVLESYRRAYEFFGLKGNSPFVCHTWLLYPGNRDFLPEKSNIRPFMDDFEIVYRQDVQNAPDLWRVFGRRESYDPNELPRDNSLRKNLAEYLETHDRVTGYGYGVFIHNGKEIVK